MREINGKLPKDVKAGAWRQMAGFDPLAGDKVDLDGCIKRIALVYGLTPAEVEDNVNLDDILPCYLECVRYLNDLVFAKLNVIPSKKN